MKKYKIWLFIIAMMTAMHIESSLANDLMPTNARVLDDDLLLWNRPAPTISPDGWWVAYISRGFVCVCEISGGKSRRLYEVPGSITHLMAKPENTPADGNYDKLSSQLYRESTAHIECLRWSHDSKGIAVSIVSHIEAEKKSICRVVYMPLNGEPTEWATAESFYSHEHFSPQFQMSRDHKYLVFDRHRRPLIWNIETNKPIATGFIKLVPSSTSERWIGVEKDTNQLVITDTSFSVVERFEEFMPTLTFGFELIWSPDERYVIWKNQVGFDHYSNWEGCRLDLKTKRRRILTGSYMKEEIEFTRRGGEFIRFGGEGVHRGWSGLETQTTYLQIVPSGDGFPNVPKSISTYTNDPEQRRLHLQAIICSKNHDLFLIGMGRREGPHGYLWHLIDRERNMWRLSNGDNQEYESPFSVAGFVGDDKTIVGYDKKRLFAFPVAEVYNNTQVTR